MDGSTESSSQAGPTLLHSRVATSAQGERAPAQILPTVKPPHVVVIVTSFGYAAFIARALASVAAQSYQDFSCVIVDDNSADDSVAVVTRWLAEQNDPRFTLIRKTENAGQLAAIATGLSGSGGQFVALLDADDVWFRDHLITHVDVHLHRIGFASFTSSDLAQIDPNDGLLAGTFRGEGFFGGPRRPRAVPVMPLTETPPLLVAMDKVHRPPALFVKPDFFRWHWSVTSGMVFRRSMLDLVMPDPKLPVPLCADHYLAHICHFFTGSILLDACLGAYRRHGANGFSTVPVYGTNAATAPFHDDRHNRANLNVMLTHVLDKSDDFAAAFSAGTVRTLVRTLTGYQLRTDRRLVDPRARALLGKAGMAWAWWREHHRRMRTG